jgi:hypothetical protein
VFAFEADETLIGGKKKNRAFAKKEPKKHTVLTLVERDGNSRSFHIANVKVKTLRETIAKVATTTAACPAGRWSGRPSSGFWRTSRPARFKSSLFAAWKSNPIASTSRSLEAA